MLYIRAVQVSAKVSIEYNFEVYDLSNGAISSENEWTLTWVSGSQYYSKANTIRNGAFYIVQLQIIYLLILLKFQYNVPLTHGPSVTAVPLISEMPGELIPGW